jgi:hypothetical protein
MQSACAVLYCRLLPDLLCHIFPHYFVNGTIFGGKVTERKMCFWFSVQLFSGTFLIVTRIHWDMITSTTAVRVKYSMFLSDFNETWIFRTDFRKILRYQISWISVQWEPSSLRTDGRTDKIKLIFVFRSFANSSSAMRALSRPGRTWCPLQEYIRHNKHAGSVHTRSVPQSRGRHCSADMPCAVYRGQYGDVGWLVNWKKKTRKETILSLL